MTKRVQIGVNPLLWTNDDLPTLGAETSLSACLSEAALAGFQGIELGDNFPRTVDALAPIMDKAGLSLVSGWYGSRLLEQDAEAEIACLQDHLHLLKSLGSPVMVFAEVTGSIHGSKGTPLSHRPMLTEEQWSLFALRLNQVADYLRDQGVVMAYHHHMGTVVQSEADIVMLIEKTSDAVGLLLDTGHLTYAGGSLERVLSVAVSRINHFHCKDVRASVLRDALNRDCSFLTAVLDGVFCIPNDGMVDFKLAFQALKSCDYSGWLVIEAEQDPSVAPSLLQAQRGFQAVYSMAREAGLMA